MSFLQKQFSERKVKKTYIALVKGKIKPEEALIDLPIERNPKAPSTFRVGSNGKSAQTRYRVLEDYANHQMLELKPVTGRTHQLRVHLAYLKHPIVGDTLYQGEKAERLYLHAHELEINLPDIGNKVFKSNLPNEFLEYEAVNVTS